MTPSPEGTAESRPERHASRTRQIQPSLRDGCNTRLARPSLETPGYVRLKAHLNSRVKVPDLADTERPVIESNCAGAITPGGEQLEMNEQSVTTIPGRGNKVNSIRSAELASQHSPGEAHNKIRLPAQREWNAAGGGPQMIGDGMFGSSGDVNQGTTVGGERAGRGQSPRSSEEASNDRGAKGGRDVVLGRVGHPSRKGPCSAARLSARMQGNPLSGGGRHPNNEPPGIQVSGAQACAAGATLPDARSRVPEPVHRRPRTGKPDAGESPVRFGWRATAKAVPYPHCRGAPPGRRPACLEQAESRLGEHHFGELRQETAAAKAERTLGEGLRRRGWREADLAERRRSDAGKLEIAGRQGREPRGRSSRLRSGFTWARRVAPACGCTGR